MSFLSGLTNAATVTFTLYFLSHGLNQTQIGTLFGFFMICMAIFNIPTGVIADIFGHKASDAIGLFLQALAFLFFFLYPTYFGFFLAMFTDALGIAFQTGALSSLSYELLRKEGLIKDYQKVVGRIGGYGLIAGMIASPIGSMIYKYHPGIPYFLSFLFFLLAALAIYLIKWEFVKKPLTISRYLDILINGTKLTIKNRVLMAIVVIGIALSVNRLVFNQNIGQPYQLSVGLDVGLIGFVAAAVSGMGAIISINAYKISKKIGTEFTLLLTVVITSFAVIALSFINTLLAIPIILILFMGHGLRDPIFSHISQEEVEPDKRSTMSSAISFLTSIIVGIMLPFWGKGIDLFGLHNGLFFLGMFTFIIGVFGLTVFGLKKAT